MVNADLDLDSGTTILQHEMPMISFASGGDTDTINFIAYVAKDKTGGRFVFAIILLLIINYYKSSTRQIKGVHIDFCF